MATVTIEKTKREPYSPNKLFMGFILLVALILFAFLVGSRSDNMSNTTRQSIKADMSETSESGPQ